MSDEIHFDVDHDAIVEYYIICMYAFGLLVVFGLGSLVAYLFINFGNGRDMIRRQVQGTRVWIQDAHLRVQQGVWHTSDTTIPLASVGQVDINQGPLVRHVGLSRVAVRSNPQTIYATSFLLPESEATRLRDVITQSELA